MKTSKFLFFVSLLLFGITISCTKYVAGPKGDSGTPGKAGNMLINQFSKTLDSLDWSMDGLNWISTIFSDQVTEQVILKGEVKVYISVDSNWFVLPYGKNYIFTQSTLEEGKITLITEHIHGGVPPRPKKNNYRIVIMKPAE